MKQHFIFSNQDKVWGRAAKGRGQDRKGKSQESQEQEEEAALSGGQTDFQVSSLGERISPRQTSWAPNYAAE